MKQTVAFCDICGQVRTGSFRKMAENYTGSNYICALNCLEKFDEGPKENPLWDISLKIEITGPLDICEDCIYGLMEQALEGEFASE